MQYSNGTQSNLPIVLLFYYTTIIRKLQGKGSRKTKYSDDVQQHLRCSVKNDKKATLFYAYLQPTLRFVTKINDKFCYRSFLSYVTALLPYLDCFEARISPYLSLYRFRLPSKTAYYLHLGRIMHPNFDCIKIGVLIWWRRGELNPCP